MSKGQKKEVKKKEVKKEKIKASDYPDYGDYLKAKKELEIKEKE